MANQGVGLDAVLLRKSWDSVLFFRAIFLVFISYVDKLYLRNENSLPSTPVIYQFLGAFEYVIHHLQK
jgi:hypothetical protein